MVIMQVFIASAFDSGFLYKITFANCVTEILSINEGKQIHQKLSLQINKSCCKFSYPTADDKNCFHHSVPLYVKKVYHVDNFILHLYCFIGQNSI